MGMRDKTMPDKQAELKHGNVFEANQLMNYTGLF